MSVSFPIAILAGGLATRLRPVTEKIPKSLVEVSGKPFIVHQIELLKQNGVRDLVLCIGHLGEALIELLGDGSSLGVDIQYSPDGKTLLGTGGALKKALPLLGSSFFVLYGDSYLDIDYRAVQRSFEQSQRLGLMTVFRNEGQYDESNIVFENGQIVRYAKKAVDPKMHHIDYGLSVLSAEAFSKTTEGEAFDLEAVFQRLIREEQLAGFEVTNRFYEIGSPSGLAETANYIASRKSSS